MTQGTPYTADDERAIQAELAETEAATAPLRTMADSAFPGNVPRKVNGKTPDIVLIYAGGDTVHPWTTPEILAMPERWRWPCWVRSNPQSHDPGLEADACINWLNAHRVPKGTAVILDLETAVNGPFVNAFDQKVHAAGWLVTKYGSQSTIWRNPRTSGGTFLALPGPAALTGEGDQVARQYLFKGGAHPYDLSVVKASVPLWDTRPPKPHGPFRHVADGTKSLAQIAAGRHTTAEHIAQVTAAAMVARAHEPMADGDVFWTSRP